MERQGTECGLRKICQTHPDTPPAEGNCFSSFERKRRTILLSPLKLVRRQLTTLATLYLVICSLTESQDGTAQTRPPGKINKSTISNGNILLNGQPFPMALDAG